MRDDGFIGLLFVLMLLAGVAAFLLYPDQTTRTASDLADRLNEQAKSVASAVSDIVEGRDSQWERRLRDRAAGARGRLRDSR